MLLPQLKRIRWAVRAALMLGVAASVAANVLHARHNPISQTISAWPPLALLLTVELTSRIPMYRRSMAAVRVLATVAIAGIAAWVSYSHMQSVAFNYGETLASSYFLPISVDGLIVVASVSLVELAGRIRVVEGKKAEASEAAAVAARPTVTQPIAVQSTAVQPTAVQPMAFASVAAQPVAPIHSAPSSPSAQHPAVRAEAQNRGHSDFDSDDDAFSDEAISSAPVSPAVAPLQRRPLGQSGGPATPNHPNGQSGSAPRSSFPPPVYGSGSAPGRSGVARPAVSTPSRTIVTSPTTKPTESSAPRQRRPVHETARLADAIEQLNPEISETELANRIGISATRLRAVRREARERHTESSRP